jgi:hypothetical protein
VPVAGWADELSGRPGATDSAVVAMVSVMAIAIAIAIAVVVVLGGRHGEERGEGLGAWAGSSVARAVVSGSAAAGSP